MAKKVKRKASRKNESKSPISPMMIGIIVVAAVLVVGGLILLSNAGQQTVADVNTTGFPTIGDPNAPVTIVEYSDFGCGHCKDFTLETYPKLKTDYIETGQVKYVVHPYYLGNPTIGLAAEAAWCANEQDKFFDYKTILFQNQGLIDYSPESLIGLGEQLGLDTASFSECVNNRGYRNDLEAARQDAEALGVNSTPTFYINDQRINGNYPYETFQEVIAQEVAKAQ